MGSRRTATGWLLSVMLPLLTPASLAAQSLAAQPKATNAPAPAAVRIYVAPPVQWDLAMFSARPALRQTPSDLGLLTGGILFGMTPSAVNGMLPEPLTNLSWNSLQSANEYPGEARYVWARLSRLPALRDGITGCMGAASHVVFLFTSSGLFRLSFRLFPDLSCPAPEAAAQQLFARFMTIGPAVALSVHYLTKDAQVIDVTDPNASFLIPIRWRMTGQ